MFSLTWGMSWDAWGAAGCGWGEGRQTHLTGVKLMVGGDISVGLSP